jgi:hypothetical protein
MTSALTRLSVSWPRASIPWAMAITADSSVALEAVAMTLVPRRTRGSAVAARGGSRRSFVTRARPSSPTRMTGLASAAAGTTRAAA